MNHQIPPFEFTFTCQLPTGKVSYTTDIPALAELGSSTWPAVGTRHEEASIDEHIAQLGEEATQLLDMQGRNFIPFKILTPFLTSCAELAKRNLTKAIDNPHPAQREQSTFPRNEGETAMLAASITEAPRPTPNDDTSSPSNDQERPRKRQRTAPQPIYLRRAQNTVKIESDDNPGPEPEPVNWKPILPESETRHHPTHTVAPERSTLSQPTALGLPSYLNDPSNPPSLSPGSLSAPQATETRPKEPQQTPQTTPPAAGSSTNVDGPAASAASFLDNLSPLINSAILHRPYATSPTFSLASEPSVANQDASPRPIVESASQHLSPKLVGRVTRPEQLPPPMPGVASGSRKQVGSIPSWSTAIPSDTPGGATFRLPTGVLHNRPLTWFIVVKNVNPRVLQEVVTNGIQFLDDLNAHLKRLQQNRGYGIETLESLKNDNVRLSFSSRMAKEFIAENDQAWARWFGVRAAVTLDTYGVIMHDLNIRAIGDPKRLQGKIKDDLAQYNKGILKSASSIRNVSWVKGPPKAPGVRSLVIYFYDARIANAAIEQGLWHKSNHSMKHFGCSIYDLEFNQCGACWRYDHEEFNCNSLRACLFCGGRHDSIEHPSSSSPGGGQHPTRCVNCDGPHRADSAVCEIRSRERARMAMLRKKGPGKLHPEG